MLRASVLITSGPAWLIGLFTLAAIASGGDASKPKEVLILYSYRHLMPINIEWDRGIRETITSSLGEPVTIDIEYLDFQRLNSRDYRAKWLELMRLKMNRYVFDWRQLRRWGIREQNLPAGSRVAFRAPTRWEEYGAYITTGAAAILLQSLLIAALLVNRRKRLRAEHALADRLQFETAFSGLSARFVHVVPETVHREIECAFEQIANLLTLDRGTIFEVSSDGLQLRATLSWVRAGQSQTPPAIPLDSIPWLWAKLNQGDTVHFSSVAELSADAAPEKVLLLRLGLKAGVAVLLKAKGTTLGMVTFGQLTRERPWNETSLNRLKLVGEVLANALAHARADKALCASREEARQLAGRLLTAQEDERKRLAREMHDDVSQ